MKKVININFQGRVIPIEETAYELLKQYIESLRIYFAKEEGRDEIINDIEGRIAELFSERLKGGVTCITDEDVNVVIAGMGRPEELEALDSEPAAASSTGTTYTAPSVPGPQSAGRQRLYRNADDKIIAGVCSGLANYLGIDPVIMRIVFVVFVGVLFWVYILLWIIVPSKSVEANITKRLYRSADQRVIGGVAGGIAAYFNIDVWIPRLIFALPFILGIISGSFHSFMWDWDFGIMPRVISGSFGGTLFITYIILWISVPVAHTAAEKLEMRGEKVNFNSIAITVKEDLEQFKVKAEKWGEEIKTSAQDLSKRASLQAKTFSHEAGYAARRTGSGLGHAISVLFKVIFIFIFTIMAVVLFSVFIALLFGGIAIAPLSDFILENSFQNSLVWLTLFLFFMVPIVALITWAIRRIMGVRSRRHYLGFAFGGLWTIGLICGVLLIATVAKNFRNYARLNEEEIGVITERNRVYVEVKDRDWKTHDNEFFGIDVDDDWPLYSVGDDSVLLNTVKLTMAKSNDSSYHVYRVRDSRGDGRQNALQTAQRIEFNPVRMDSVIELPQGFFINKTDKFRNQRVWIVVEIPVGKIIGFSRNIQNYNWFNVHNKNNRWNDDDEQDDYDYYKDKPEPGQEYIMKPDGRPEKISSL
ncbi:MAG TPA: PspC domain-containing protein [Flavitalea sp.]|nr:PspC domain-containing protein [Flavitalea sp.]